MSDVRQRTERRAQHRTGQQSQQGTEERRPLWAVVAQREVAVKLTDRSFLVGTAVSLLLIVGLVGLQAWLDSRTESFRVAVTDRAAVEVVDVVERRAPELDDAVSVERVSYADDSAAREAVLDEEVDAWLRPPAGEGGSWTLQARGTPDDGLERIVVDVLEQRALAAVAERAGTTTAEFLEGSALVAEPLEGDAGLAELRDILGFALAFLFYISAVMFGMTLANSVVEEKQSRIVEIIAAAMPLRHLLAGKIVGNSLLALAQLLVYLGVGAVALTFTDYGDLVPVLSAELGWFLLFFLVGFVALSCLWAVAGALASRTEDLQHTSGAVTTLLLAMFFGALFLEGPVERAASYVPPLSALLMPMRLVDGTASWWEPLVALALLVLTGAALVLGAERLYRRALLRSGGRLTLRAAWRLEE